MNPPPPRPSPNPDIHELQEGVGGGARSSVGELPDGQHEQVGRSFLSGDRGAALTLGLRDAPCVPL